MKKGINQWLFPDTMSIERCMAVAKDAGFDGIEICMGEDTPKSKGKSSRLEEEFRDFIDRFNSKYVGALFDVANTLAYAYPEQWIDELAGRIKSVHVKDFMTSVGNINGFVNIFEGDVDWPKVMKAFHRVGYDGYLTVETIPAYKYCPESRIYESSIALDRLLNL